MTSKSDVDRHKAPGLFQGLSGKVLVMTILCLMLG